MTKKTKLVRGMGTKDIDDICYYYDGDNKLCLHKFYRYWMNMLERSYSEKFHEKKPTYIGCSVSEEWLSLSEFKVWFDQTYIEGWQLDKDLLVKGNKEYGPDTCCWVPNELNSFLVNKRVNKGEFPTGVHFNKSTGKFVSSIHMDNKRKYLGLYETQEAAHLAYANVKQKHLILLLKRYASQLDDRVVVRISEMISMSVEQFRDEFC